MNAVDAAVTVALSNHLVLTAVALVVYGAVWMLAVTSVLAVSQVAPTIT